MVIPLKYKIFTLSCCKPFYSLIHNLAILFGEPSILYTNWMKNSQVSAEKTKKQHGKTRAVFADNFILKDLRQRLHKPSKLLLP